MIARTISKRLAIPGVLLLGTVAPVLAQAPQEGRRGYGMMMGYDGGGWFWGMAMHALVAALFIALLVVVVVLLVRWVLRSDDGRSREADGRSAAGILDARYARGEIDRDEYLQKKQDLG